LIRQFGNTMVEMESVKRTMAESYESLVESLVEFDTNIADALAMQKEVAAKRELYDAAISRLNKIEKKSGAAKQPKVEAEAAQTRQVFELAAFEFVDKLTRIDIQQHTLLVSSLCQHFISTASAFKRGAAVQSDQMSFALDASDRVAARKSEYSDELVEGRKVALASRLAAIGAAGGHVPEERDNTGIEKQGYLYKRGKNIGTKRRWFVVRDGSLQWFKSWDDVGQPIGELPLLFCTARAHDDPKEHVFEIVSREKSLLLQAENKDDLMSWMAVFQNAVTQGLNVLDKRSAGAGAAANDDPLTNPDSTYNRVRAFSAANTLCADCGVADPTWASISHGVTLCIACSGAHRFLGVVISKVRSLTLDVWEPVTVNLMAKLGNELVNEVLEKKLAATKKLITPASARPEREAFIAAKYRDHAFLGGGSRVDRDDPSRALFDAAEAADFVKLVRCRAAGGDLNYAPNKHGSLLHGAVARNQLEVIEWALLNGAQTSLKNDVHGDTPLHVAARSDARVDALGLLVRRGAALDATNAAGLTPLDLATKEGADQCADVLALAEEARERLEASLWDDGGESDNDVPLRSSGSGVTRRPSTTAGAMPVFVGNAPPAAMRSSTGLRPSSPSKRNAARTLAQSVRNSLAVDAAPTSPSAAATDDDVPVVEHATSGWNSMRRQKSRQSKTTGQLAEALSSAVALARASATGAGAADGSGAAEPKSPRALDEFNDLASPRTPRDADAAAAAAAAEETVNSSGRRRKKKVAADAPPSPSGVGVVADAATSSETSSSLTQSRKVKKSAIVDEPSPAAELKKESSATKMTRRSSKGGAATSEDADQQSAEVNK
jgi:Arf-GAP/coiled-coil/ANK repeat/PH domain-containing protein